jgi:hypothetical protein
VVGPIKAGTVTGEVQHKHILRGDSTRQLFERALDCRARGLLVSEHSDVDGLIEARALFAKHSTDGLGIPCCKAHALLQLLVAVEGDAYGEYV